MRKTKTHSPALPSSHPFIFILIEFFLITSLLFIPHSTFRIPHSTALAHEDTLPSLTAEKASSVAPGLSLLRQRSAKDGAAKEIQSTLTAKDGAERTVLAERLAYVDGLEARIAKDKRYQYLLGLADPAGTGELSEAEKWKNGDPVLFSRYQNERGDNKLFSHLPTIVHFAKYLLDREDFKGKKLVFLGRASDLIYDAAEALAHFGPAYAERQKDLYLVDWARSSFKGIPFKAQAQYIADAIGLDPENPQEIVLIDETVLGPEGSGDYTVLLSEMLTQYLGIPSDRIDTALMSISDLVIHYERKNVYRDVVGPEMREAVKRAAEWLGHWYESERAYEAEDKDGKVALHYNYFINYGPKRLFHKMLAAIEAKQLLEQSGTARDGASRSVDAIPARGGQVTAPTDALTRTKVSEDVRLPVKASRYTPEGTQKEGVILTLEGKDYFSYFKDIQTHNAGKGKVPVYELHRRTAPKTQAEVVEIVPLEDERLITTIQSAMRLFSSFLNIQGARVEEFGWVIDVLYLPKAIQISYDGKTFHIDRKTGEVAQIREFGEQKSEPAAESYLFLASLPMILRPETRDQALAFFEAYGGRLDSILFAAPGTFDKPQEEAIPFFDQEWAFGAEGERAFESGLDIVNVAERLVALQTRQTAKLRSQLTVFQENFSERDPFVLDTKARLARTEGALREAEQALQEIRQFASLEDMFRWIQSHSETPTPLQQEALEHIGKELNGDATRVFFVRQDSLLARLFNLKTKGLHGVLNLGKESGRVTFVDAEIHRLPKIAEALTHEYLHHGEVPLSAIPLDAVLARYVIEGVTQDRLTETMRSLISGNTPFAEKLRGAIEEEIAGASKEDILHAILFLDTLNEDRKTGALTAASDPVSEWLAAHSAAYLHEREFARTLSNAVGQDVLETLYTRGDAAPLQKALGNRLHFLRGLSLFLSDPALKPIVHRYLVEAVADSSFDETRYKAVRSVLFDVKIALDEKRDALDHAFRAGKFSGTERWWMEEQLTAKLRRSRVVPKAVEAVLTGSLEENWIQREMDRGYREILATHNINGGRATDGGKKEALLDALWDAIHGQDQRAPGRALGNLNEQPDTWGRLLPAGKYPAMYRAINVIERLLHTKLGFSKSDAADIARVTSELTDNVLKHAQSGAVVLTKIESEGLTGARVIVMDRGPGIPEDNLKDLFQLPADNRDESRRGFFLVGKEMDEVQIETHPGRGTQVTIIQWSRPKKQEAASDGGRHLLPVRLPTSQTPSALLYP
ncbi:MAG: ATP-binding protein [Candidatus Omnitrophota bacterium]